MSSEAKRVKILTLVQLILGLALTGFAVFLLVTGTEALPCALVGADGLATLVFGGRGALIANVPARLGKLAKLAFIMFFVECALIAGLIFAIGVDKVNDQPLPVAAAGLAAVITLTIALQARGIARSAER